MLFEAKLKSKKKLFLVFILFFKADNVFLCLPFVFSSSFSWTKKTAKLRENRCKKFLCLISRIISSVIFLFISFCTNSRCCGWFFYLSRPILSWWSLPSITSSRNRRRWSSFPTAICVSAELAVPSKPRFFWKAAILVAARTVDVEKHLLFNSCLQNSQSHRDQLSFARNCILVPWSVLMPSLTSSGRVQVKKRNTQFCIHQPLLKAQKSRCRVFLCKKLIPLPSFNLSC